MKTASRRYNPVCLDQELRREAVVEQAFVTNFIFPLLAAGVTGLSWAAVKHPELFRIIAWPVAYLCLWWIGAAMVFDYGMLAAFDHTKSVVPVDLVPKIETSIDKIFIPAWVIAVPSFITTIIVALMIIWRRLHYRRPLPKKKPEQDDAKT
jgi:hypothetical protein